jgi:alpha/beta superfamily hydrolase
MSLAVARSILRTPLFFGPEQRSLFGWYHAPDGRRELAVVICPPFGRESIESYRSLGELADRLAEQGIGTLRFDYDGTGDSAGGDTEAARVAAWRESIVTAMQTLSALSGCERIALAGFRLGATLAVSVASELEVAALVLWAPCLRGRTYVSELQAMSASGESEALEPGGFLVTADTQLELGCLDLAMHPPKTPRAFIALCDDEQLRESWSEAGMDVEQRTLSGDDEIAGEIVNWLTDVAGEVRTTTTGTPDVRSQQTIGELRETLVRFGAAVALFGIVSEPLRPSRAAAATVILLNDDAAHHVGPNRLYVFLARALSRAGFRVLRFDGDLDDATGSVAEAIRMLDQQRSPSSFVLAGLGSGASNALRAALELERDPIVESILINPPMLDRDEGTEPMPHRGWWAKLFRRGDEEKPLERDLTRIAESGRKVIFLFSRFEPGFDLLMGECLARREALPAARTHRRLAQRCCDAHV